ncbi:aminotransferase class I/II-fold pyridoxal phosphate-dependent enzyme [Phytohabitans sp. ZYX-F-186]|uniref:Aminotransferase class I/II-fold pyridoxal phosphate-dependent enzyme n=1 Tax=Phytohabitans maris TaxID=3071409 RepID=A0ABU0ZPN0_9ACTN|nr:aminotransferase class I/II-fold pyridoxal phosphate-dependent enzyme [Phytohabitans sp. ZYX-F-186]MDQ7909001.1 aminotransferase class I/II-fold pyridoxal phosphate-dependent enzyme [Phytohabitans sp. ZYX-F-186]
MHTAELVERITERDAGGIARCLAGLIHDRALPAGARLPTVRKLATALGVSPTTVSEAWRELQRHGLIEARGRAGTTVSYDPRPAAESRFGSLQPQRPGRLDLSTGTPDPALLPSLRPAMTTAPGDARISSYFDPPVLPELEALLRADWPYEAGELMVVDGAMDAMERVIAETVRYGDTVLVENPTFPAILDLLQRAGATVVGIPPGPDGPDLEPLREALAGEPACLILQPRAHNPTGHRLTGRRAAGIAALLPERTIVIEDDHSAALCQSPLVSLGGHRPEQTVHIRGFSKALGPDLRLAALSAPPAVMRPLVGRRQLGPAWSSRLLQAMLVNLLTSDVSRAEVAAARAAYAERRLRLTTALAAYGIAVEGHDGFNLWLPVRDESAALVHLASHGVTVAPGSPFWVNGLPRAPHVRITAACVTDGFDELGLLLAEAAQLGSYALGPAR